MTVTYTEEALADIVEAIRYLNDRNPTAAANLDAEIGKCIDRLASEEFDGPLSRLRSGALVRSWAVPPFRVYYQRHAAELLSHYTLQRLMFECRRTSLRRRERSRGPAEAVGPSSARRLDVGEHREQRCDQ